MRITGTLTLLLALLLTACGSDARDGSASASNGASATSSSEGLDDAALPTDEPTPTPSPTRRPQVSDRTTCDLLFNSQGKSPLAIIVDFVNRPSNTLQQANATDEAIDDLRSIALSAGDNLSAQLTAEADAAQAILDGARAGSDETYDTTALRAAGLEIANTCQGLY